MPDIKAEAERLRSDINREISKADSGGSNMPDKQGVTGAVTTVTGTVSGNRLWLQRCPSVCRSQQRGD